MDLDYADLHMDVNLAAWQVAGITLLQSSVVPPVRLGMPDKTAC